MSSEIEDLSDIGEIQYQVVPSIDEPLTRNETPVEEEELEEEGEEKDTPAKPIHPIISFLFKTLKILLLPFCKILFAPAAQRTVVKTSVFMVTLSWIFVTSLIAYVLFYNKYVPPITHVQPIWFDYGHGTPQAPTALVDISSALRHEQVYEVSVQLHVPTSDVNFAIGNFMINIELQTNNGSIIVKSTRPGILRYQSQAQRVIKVFAHVLLLLVGIIEESQVITFKLVDEYRELKSQALSKVFISLSDPKLQIYDAKLLVLANFKGLRYYMYFYSFSTAMAFILTFASVEFICATIAWKGFGENLWHKLSIFFNEVERQSESDETTITTTTTTTNSSIKSE